MCLNEKRSKLLLIIINSVFIVLGLGIFIPGLLMVINVEVINDKILPLMQQITVGAFNLGDLAKGLSISLMAIGGFILAVSMLGTLGACCQNKCCLFFYAIIVAILLFGTFVIVVLCFFANDKITNSLKTELKDVLVNKYSHDDLTSDEVSTAWNYMFMQLECCGVDSVTSATNDFDNTTWQAGTPSTDIPLGCCPGVTADSYASASATNAACTSASGVAPVGQYSKGCYEAVKDLISAYSIAFIVILVLILIIEMTGVIAALSLYERNNYKDLENEAE